MASSRRLHGIRVLVVDDNADHLTIVRDVLAHAGAAVETALSAQEGFDAFQGAPHDVVISDLAMPQATGYNLIRRIRTSPWYASIPAIAMTAYSEDEHRAKALDAGFNEWMAKPATSAVVDLVAALVGR
jgi:CheY-like chemotaxis protein